MSASFSIACTKCAYCSDRCPLDIPVPQYFEIYNQFLKAETREEKQKSQEKYFTLSASKSKASECLRCGKCVDFCSEHLPIISFLQDIAEEFEDY